LYGGCDARDVLAGATKRQENEGIRNSKEKPMSIAKVTEITASSKKGFQDAIEQGLARAAKTLEGIKGAWIQEQNVIVENNRISEYRVNMKVTFILKD
jgi:flavin-binding protein dodecin